MGKGTRTKTTKTVRAVVAGKVVHASGAATQHPSALAVAARAFELFELEGRAHGRDVEHWLRAEAELAAGQR